jgi:transposase
LRTNLKLQVYSVLAKEGIHVPMTDLFGVAGRALLATAPLAPAYAGRVDSLLDLIEGFDRQIRIFEGDVRRELAEDPGYLAIQAIPGFGEIFAAIFVAEVGDVTRFTSPAHLCSWVGLTPRHRESDTTLHRGPITKQGPRLVRWAAVEAAQRQAYGTKLRADFSRIAANHGDTPGARKVARVAVARKYRHPRLLWPQRRHRPLEGDRADGVTRSGHHQARGRFRSRPPGPPAWPSN